MNPYNTIWQKKGCSKYLLTEIEAYAVGCIVNAHPQAQLSLSLGECINSAFHPAFLPPMVGETLEDKFILRLISNITLILTYHRAISIHMTYNNIIRSYRSSTVGRTIIPDLFQANGCNRSTDKALSGSCIDGVTLVPHLI